jgi:biopolymer transport protein TolR
MPTVSSSRRRGRRGFVSEINVVPYIDVMLVLLVIFMVTAPLVPTGVIDLATVGASSAQPNAYVEIQVLGNGQLKLVTRNLPQKVERPIGRRDIGGILREIGDPKALPVVITGEKQVKYESVLEVMDEVRAQGVTRVALMVKSAK